MEEERRRLVTAGTGRYDPSEEAGRAGVAEGSGSRDLRGFESPDDEALRPKPKRFRVG